MISIRGCKINNHNFWKKDVLGAPSTHPIINMEICPENTMSHPCPERLEDHIMVNEASTLCEPFLVHSF